jgi:hypothetical protein
VREEVRAAAKTMRRAMRLDPAWYRSAQLTQEQVAENVQRLRADYCFTGWSDHLHRFVPRPVAPRIAHIRVPQPIEVTGVDAADALLLELRQRMQGVLDDLAEQQLPNTGARTYPNPFR